MNELTLEEKEILKRLSEPVVPLRLIKVKLDEIARSHGYEDHQDLLLKTGWLDRFSKVSDD